MSIRELESLVAIADRGSITAAAESLYLSVPAVSAHIASMEERLRTKLLDRRRKPASLNAAGLLLSERARAVLRGYRDFYATSAENADLAGSLTLGAAATLLTGVLFVENFLVQKLTHKTVLSVLSWLVFGGLLYLSGAVVMAANVWLTILGKQREEAPLRQAAYDPAADRPLAPVPAE